MVRNEAAKETTTGNRRKQESSTLVSHQELLEHNDFFDMLVDMIPSKLYVAQPVDNTSNSKYYKKQTEDSKQARKAAAKLAKRRKLDPATAETTLQVKQRMESIKTQNSEDNGDDNNDEIEREETNSDSPDETSPARLASGSRIEALRAKLHAKIEKLGGNRPAPDQVSKRAARRAEKLKRRQEATQKAQERQKQVKAEKFTAAANEQNNINTNPLQQVDFGRLTGWEDEASTKNYTQTNKSLRNLASGKNIHKLLADAQKKKELLKTDAAQTIQWKDALSEAKGVRVKDDTAKLSKKIQQKAARKRKSQKAWETRLQQQQSAQKSKQAIRQHNLQQRKKGGTTGANLSKKRIVTADGEDCKKKKRQRAGFEGRRREFLN